MAQHRRAELFLAGVTHYPPLSGTDENMAGLLEWTLGDPAIPVDEADPANWPPLARDEWGTDRGATGAAAHRAALVAGLRTVRAALDEFEPDVVVIWGDDQHENFHEDLIPPYAVLAYDDLTLSPWRDVRASSDMVGKPNVWNEPADWTLEFRGAPDTARWLVEQLLGADFDVAYAYEPLHHPGLSHAFLNTMLYLDYDRRGFPYPVIPMPVNCYGRRVVSAKGFMTRLDDDLRPDPPSPSPRRLMALGAAIARAFSGSDQRVALIASSSWSHAFLVDHTHRLRPDLDADRRLYRALVDSDYDTWATLDLAAVEHAGQQELLNWCILLGAARELGAELAWSTMVETLVFNSNKVFATWHPTGGR